MTTSTAPGTAARPEGTPGGSPVSHPRRAGVGWGLALIVAGGLWSAHALGVAVPWELVLPVAVTLIGGTVLVLGILGHAGGGLIGLGAVLGVVALLGATTPGPASLTAGDRLHAPTEVGQLAERYELGAGTMVLDLRELELPPGTTTVTAGVQFGELQVLVPPGVALTGEVRAAAGELETPDGRRDGMAPRLMLGEGRTPTGGSPTLELDLRVSFGRIEVTP